jgi:hypothetical protein
MSGQFSSYMIFLLLGGMLVVALAAMLRSVADMVGPERRRKRPQPIVPFIDFVEPDPVTMTPGVRTVGVTTMVWSILNILVSIYWLMLPFGVERRGESVMGAAYVLLASLIGLLGSLMLLAEQRQGRRLIAWFGFLMVTLAFLGLGFSLIRMNVGTPSDRDLARAMAFVFGFHILADTLIASSAQHVGAPQLAPDA